MKALSESEKQRRAEARTRAEAGAAVLDEKVPGWFKQISLKDLDLSSGCSCIAGQLVRKSRARVFRDGRRFRMWSQFVAHINGTDSCDTHEQQEQGFMAGRGVDWSHLDMAWGRIIRRKLREAEASA